MKRHLIFILFLSVSILRGLAADRDPRQNAFYQIEYRWVPVMVGAYQEQGTGLYLFNDLKLWQYNIKTNYPDIYEHFAWDSLQVQTYGQPGDSLIVVLYDFPEPFATPLATYGAVVIRSGTVTYYTFEMSYDGYYVLGTTDVEWTHTNLGFYKPKTMQEFLGIVCNEEGIVLLEQPL